MRQRERERGGQGEERKEGKREKKKGTDEIRPLSETNELRCT